MIAVDTNVLVRIFARDDEAQRARAVALIEGGPADQKCLVNLAVLVELFWTLKRVYSFERDELAKVARQLTDHPRLFLPDRNELRDAAHLCRENGSDIPDNLIALVSRRLGASTTYTFDTRTDPMAGFSPVPA